MTTPQRYAPRHLSRKDRMKQRRELAKSRRLYKEGRFHNRAKVKSFKARRSTHTRKAKAMYRVASVKADRRLAGRTRCSVRSLKAIVKKGMGAYYSSGSRPNQTAQSWGRARLASAITGGPAARVDIDILKKGCGKNSRALRLARERFPKN